MITQGGFKEKTTYQLMDSPSWRSNADNEMIENLSLTKANT